jgi:hypothetical protein
MLPGFQCIITPVGYAFPKTIGAYISGDEYTMVNNSALGIRDHFLLKNSKIN